ncbi:hypothetical protein Q8F55_004545 [Vanrija albida]|uniref:Uncharacterized protein n=1 Tax=Vanrija albida TaxID=181172 RepID=A0ABR3Q7B5_9TREE
MPRWGPKTRLLIPSTPDHVVRDSSPTLNHELYATTPVRERTPADEPPDPINDPTATPASEYAGPIHHDAPELAEMTQRRAPDLFISTPRDSSPRCSSPRSRSGGNSPAKGATTPTSPWTPRTPTTAETLYPPPLGRSNPPPTPNPIRETRKEWGRPDDDSGPIHSPSGDKEEAPDLNSVHRYPKAVRRLPFRRPPGYEDAGWLRDGDRATQWLSCFYDLVVVAVLSTFSSTHKISVPSAIGIFFSYYIIVICVWTTQIHYDVRYEAEDTFHRIMKLLQIIVLIYFGISSGGWDPSKLGDYDVIRTDDDRLLARLLTAATKGDQSWKTVVIAFAVSRALLAFQYIFGTQASSPTTKLTNTVTFAGRKAKRPNMGPKLAAVSSIVSGVLAVVSVTVEASSESAYRGKIAALYLGIAIELFSTWFDMYAYKVGERANSTPVIAIAERYALFSLIILGEGFALLSGQFGKAVDGLDIKDPSVYAQVFLVILVVYNVWSFLFSVFNQNDTINPRKTAWWEIIHVPLHFSILLLLAAMVVSVDPRAGVADCKNIIVISSFYASLTKALDFFAIFDEDDSPALQKRAGAKTELDLYLFFNRLDPALLSSYPDTVPGDATNNQTAIIYGFTFLGSVVKAICEKSSTYMSDEVSTYFGEVIGTNVSDYKNQTLVNHTSELFGRALNGVVDDAYSGTLWLFPAAGITLILCAARSLTRYHLQGISHRIVHWTQMATGVVLALLGLLDIGDKSLLNSDQKKDSQINLMYRLVDAEGAIAIVACVYTAVNIGTFTVLTLIHRRRGGVFTD